MPAHFKDDLQKGKYHSGDILPEEYDEGNRGKRHKDLVGHENSQYSALSANHVLAIRLYSTSSYKRFNQPLRNKEKPHSFRMSVYELDEGMRNLLAVVAKKNALEFSSEHLLYRCVCVCVCVCVCEMCMCVCARACVYICEVPLFYSICCLCAQGGEGQKY
jgi:hypothetical protein